MQSKPLPRASDLFRVDRRGVLRFVTGQRARAAEIQSTDISCRRISPSTGPMWLAWFVAGVVVNSAMGSSTTGGEYNAVQGAIAALGLLGGPLAILWYRGRMGYFIDVQGSGSLITSLFVGPMSPQVEARAYGLADELIAVAEENAYASYTDPDLTRPPRNTWSDDY